MFEIKKNVTVAGEGLRMRQATAIEKKIKKRLNERERKTVSEKDREREGG